MMEARTREAEVGKVRRLFVLLGDERMDIPTRSFSASW